MKKPGLLIVLSGPSGAGKGTICRALLREHPGLCFSVSATTRWPREGERDGIDYFFYTEEEFRARIERGEFLEWAIYDENYYGTPRAYVEHNLAEGRDVLLDIEIHGARQVKEKYPEGVFIFVVPPSMDELRNRLTKRGSEGSDGIQRRLEIAKEQLKYIHMYDYIVVNDEVASALKNISAIIIAEKCRVSRQGRGEWYDSPIA